jgi:Zn-finger nucleic acid-binding protein
MTDKIIAKERKTNDRQYNSTERKTNDGQYNSHKKKNK